MPPETGSFSPALTEALETIRKAENLSLFFGEREKTVIPGLEPRQYKNEDEFVDETLVDLAQACGTGKKGEENLAKLVRGMKSSGMITDEESKDFTFLGRIPGLLAFPADNDRDKRSRDCFDRIVRDESIENCRFKDLCQRTLDIMAWLESQPGGPEDLLEKYWAFIDLGRIKRGQEIKLQSDELEVKPIPDRAMPAALIEVRKTGKSLEILPNKGQNWENNQEAIAANLTLGEHNLTLSVMDDDDSTSLKLQAEMESAYLHTDILNRLKAVKGFEGASKSSGVIEIKIDGQEFWISKIGVGNGDGINIRWRQNGQFFIEESFADLCRLATAAFNLALGLPVPEATGKPAESRPVPPAAEKPAKPITGSPPEPEW